MQLPNVRTALAPSWRRISARAGNPVERVDTAGFWRDGYTIVPKVYTRDEIEQFRADIERSAGPKSDLLANAHLRRVLTDGRLVRIAQRILGTDGPILYAGDSSFTVGNVQHGWHKDCADRTDPKAPDWRSRYTVLRFGVYLQDHRFHTGGLNLRVGSHEAAQFDTGRNVYVRTGVGDVGVWSLRITHSGNGKLLKFPWAHYPEPSSEDRYPAWTYASADREPRMALFAALGLDDEHHRRYTDYLKTRTYIVNMWRNSSYHEDAIAEAQRGGLQVRDLPSEVRDDPTAGKNKTWAPMPY